WGWEGGRGGGRPGSRRGVDRRAEAGRAGGRVLRLRLRRRAQRDEDAHRARFRRTFPPRRRLGMVRLRRRARAAAGCRFAYGREEARVSAKKNFYSDNVSGAAPEILAALVAVNAGDTAPYGGHPSTGGPQAPLGAPFWTGAE